MSVWWTTREAVQARQQLLLESAFDARLAAGWRRRWWRSTVAWMTERRRWARSPRAGSSMPGRPGGSDPTGTAGDAGAPDQERARGDVTSVASARPAPRAIGGVVSFGAHDVERLRSFYADVGWPRAGDGEHPGLFDVGALIVEIVPISSLARRASALTGGFMPGLRFTVHFVARAAHDVDALTSAMAAAGAVVTRQPTDDASGQARLAVAADPEGNFWEIAWSGRSRPLPSVTSRVPGSGP